MRSGISVLTALGLVLLGACNEEDFIWTPTTEGSGSQDMNKDGGACPSQPDLLPPAPACAAARGLTGEALVCEDFTNRQMAPSVDALAGKGWDFFGKPDCWQTSNGFLEVKSFATFATDCKFAPRAVDLSRPEWQKYQRVTLSLIHRVDLNTPEHQARIYIKDDTDNANQLYFNTNKLTALRQQMTFTLQRNDPANPGLNDLFKFVLKINSTGAVATRQGWQFESIAVMGQP